MAGPYLANCAPFSGNNWGQLKMGFGLIFIIIFYPGIWTNSSAEEISFKYVGNIFGSFEMFYLKQCLNPGQFFIYFCRNLCQKVGTKICLFTLRLSK
jgi:hypothetical protein